MVSDGAEFEVGNIEKLFKKARQNTKVKQEKWAKYYNRRRRDVNIRVNDWVLVKTHPIRSATKKVVPKFKPKFEGPYRVLRVQNNNVVIWRAGRRITVNIDHVRIYHQRKRDERVIAAESSVSSGSNYQPSSLEENRPRLDHFRSSESGERRGEQEKKTSSKNQGGGAQKKQSKEKQALTTYVSEIELPTKLVLDLQEKRCKSKGDQSCPENYLKGKARTIRVDTPDSKPSNMVANSRSRIRRTDDPAIIVQDKVDTPDSKIARKLMEDLRVGGPHHLMSLLEMSRKEERSFSQLTDHAAKSRALNLELGLFAKQQVSAQTVQQRLLQHGLSARRTWLRLLLTLHHRQESSIHQDGHNRVWWQRRLAECVHHRHTGPSPGMMVWGAIGCTSRPPLVHIDGTLNSARYISGVPVVLPFI
ncbi:uncharacterized protein TNCV_4318041 [Trichonephila clavipes]|nr:uncharacterized protein TNCV_4318041 [Trichonephila clavipes]